MPLNRALILMGLVCLCAIILAIAWTGDSQIFMFLPGRRLHRGPLIKPCPPVVPLVILVVGAILTVWAGRYGIYTCIALAVMVSIGAVACIVSHLAADWTQYATTVALIALCTYGWMQRDYFDD